MLKTYVRIGNQPLKQIFNHIHERKMYPSLDNPIVHNHQIIIGNVYIVSKTSECKILNVQDKPL